MKIHEIIEVYFSRWTIVKGFSLARTFGNLALETWLDLLIKVSASFVSIYFDWAQIIAR